MKKIIFMLAAFLFCFQIAGFTQTRIGISGGVSIADMRGAGFFYAGSLTKWGGDIDATGKTGYITGLVLETPIKKSFAFRPTLSYVQKVTNKPAPGLIEKVYTALRYAEFTTDFLYYMGGNVDGQFFIGGGPSIAFNLPSKNVSVTGGVKTTSVIKFGREYGKDIKGFNYGANYIAGWRSKGGLFLSVNYNRGFRNLVPEGSPAFPAALTNSGSIKDSYVGLQVGYYLNKVEKTKKAKK